VSVHKVPLTVLRLPPKSLFTISKLRIWRLRKPCNWHFLNRHRISKKLYRQTIISQKTTYSRRQKNQEKLSIIHNITSYAVMNITANALISIGASPVMTHATEEMKDMIALTSALLINIISMSKK